MNVPQPLWQHIPVFIKPANDNELYYTNTHRPALPGLLHNIVWQEEAAHIRSLVVIFGKRHQVAVNWVRSHDGKGEAPGRGNDLQSVGLGLPDPGL